VAGADLAGKFPFPDILRPAKSGRQPLPAFQFQPFSSSLSLLAFSHLRFSLKLLSALLETTNLFGF
jgi:hypothetical protein